MEDLFRGSLSILLFDQHYDAVSTIPAEHVRIARSAALVGAQTGLSGIPQRFLDGLEQGETLQQLARDLASKVGASSDPLGGWNRKNLG